MSAVFAPMEVTAIGKRENTAAIMLTRIAGSGVQTDMDLTSKSRGFNSRTVPQPSPSEKNTDTPRRSEN